MPSGQLYERPSPVLLYDTSSSLDDQLPPPRPQRMFFVPQRFGVFSLSQGRYL